jgi:hypothetical protein
MENNSTEQRWTTGIEGLSKYLECPERVAWGLREKGCPATKIGKRLFFELTEVDSWLRSYGPE